MTIALIGYGNTLRQDDGAGYLIAATVQTWQLPQVIAIACPQLLPELAATIAEVDHVLFVDTCLPTVATTLHHCPLCPPTETGPLDAHVSNPRSLLALSQWLYGQCPPASWLMIPGHQFELGETLSPDTETAMAAALEWIQAWLAERGIIRPQLLETCHA